MRRSSRSTPTNKPGHATHLLSPQVLVYYLERLEREEEGRISWLFDCKDAGLRNLDLELINFIIACMQHHYPDFLNYIYVLELPWLLGAAFKLVKAALPAAGRAKLRVGK